ncbi:unnamed protein product [Ambrosiozyma monospora]|uniref:Unnamed protein product n=1 Tax=Ambrosiozyma monospora TaxID=43982 RepID=A0ACB5U0Q9_AMBMO|nr:unnamed protein product [Ambrosiozyma monospora]
MPVMVSDSFHHYIVWFKRTDRVAKHTTWESDSWKVLHGEPQFHNGGIKDTKSGNSYNSHETKENDDESMAPEKTAEINCNEVEFQYMELNNLEQGFTIRKKLLGLIYAELQNDPITPPGFNTDFELVQNKETVNGLQSQTLSRL